MTPGLVCVGFLHPGEQKSCFTKSLQDLLFFDAAHNGRIVSHPHGQIGLETAGHQLVAGRNQVARAVIDSAAEWLFMIDADMGFAPDTVEQLIAAADPVTRPVVGGLAFAQKSDGDGPFFARRYRATPTLYQAFERGDEIGFVPMFDYPRNELVEVDGTGAAILLVHRSVLEAIGDRWFDQIELPKGKNGRTVFGEDMSFCLRVKAAGFPIFVHTGVKTTHDKGGVFFDEETYDIQQWVRTQSNVTGETVDVVIPTFGRPERLAAVADNVFDTTAHLGLLVFVVEADDMASIDAINDIRDQRVRCVVNTGERSYAGAVNTAVAWVEAGWLFTGADDLCFRAGWDDAALLVARRTGAKVIGTNDLWNHAVLAGRHSTHSLVAMDYINGLGATADAVAGKVLHEYHHNFVDPELVQVAMFRAVYAHCHTSVVEHMHPLAHKGEWDDTYRDGSSKWDEDEVEFLARSKMWSRS